MKLTSMIGAAALAIFFAIAPACAQDGPHTHPAYDATNEAQDQEIAKALSADALIVEGMADLDRRMDALEAATAGLSSSTADLAARVKALEDAAAPDPDPLPDPDPTPDPTPPPQSGNVLTIDATKRFQTINGWSVTTRAWEQDKVADKYDPSYIAAAPEMVADLVNEVGVNRIRVEIQSGAENPTDYWKQFTSGALSYTGLKAKYYENINDNADPFVANAAGFKWSQLDEKMDALVMPLRAALAAKGEKLWINLNVVDFGTGDLGSLSLATQPEEYAELVVEAFKHLKTKYGVTPDSLEIILEPDNGGTYTGAQIGAAIKATKARMAAAGFAPQIIAPSTMKASASLTYYDAIKTTGAKVDVLAYHTYGTTDDATVSAIGAKGAAEGIETAMLEKIDAGVDQLHRDLTLANVTAWLQWGMASKTDNGNNLLVGDPAKPVGSQISMGSKTRGLAQVWRHVRRGYVRVGASTNFAGVKALAFEAPGGGRLAVGITTGAKNFAIAGLPAGSYAVEYTTAAALSVKSGPFTVAAGASLPVSIPAAGVLVAYPVGATPPPPPPPDPDPNPNPGPVGNLLPNTADGLPVMQLNVGHHIYWQGENPYKNLRLLYPEYGGGPKVEAGEADPTTGWIYMKPGEVLVLGRVRPVQANGINTDPGEYVLKASIKPGSTADITALGFSNNGGDATTIRKTAILDDQDLNGNEVKLNGGASGGWIKVDFWGPTKWENDPLGWHPDFLKDVARYKIVRFLDWTTTNGGAVTEAWEWIDDGDYTIYNSTNSGQKPLAANDNLRKFGYSYGRMFDLANKADSTVWVNIPITMGARAIKTELLTKKPSIIKPAIVANFAAIEASAKIEYRLLAEKLARSAVAQNYPDNKVLLIELGNEIWNSGNASFAASTAFADGVGMALNGGADYDTGTGLGHMAVIAFDAFSKAFAQIKPGQEVKFVLGVQTMGGTSRAKKAAAEFDRYAPTIGVDPKLRLKIFLATTNYFSGGWQWNKNRSPGVGNNPFDVSDEGAFNAAFAAADADGSLFQKLKAWYLGPYSANVNVARLKAETLMWRDYAVNNGWRSILNYEGSPADTVGSLPADAARGRPYDQLGYAYPQSAQTWKTWIRSQEAFDVQDAYLQMLMQIDTSNPKITDGGWLPDRLVIANYMLTGRDPNYGSPWTEKNPLEAGQCPTQGFIGAWCKYLRP